MKFELPALPYAYDALEPFIDKQTMEVHHTKHHQAYVLKLNEAIEKHPELGERPLDELLREIDRVPDDVRAVVKNFGGGHANHSLFWISMGPSSANTTEGGTVNDPPPGKFSDALRDSFGDFPAFKDQFSKTAAALFGSGWTWLVTGGGDEKLVITTTQNQDSPLMKHQTPIFCFDAWEHAYYLKYQNRRPEYIDAWWHVVNWAAIAERFEKMG
jgi:Fe-Mn family superoxide dismutase